MPQKFNRAAAKAAGYTDAEIDAYLASRNARATDTSRPVPSESAAVAEPSATSRRLAIGPVPRAQAVSTAAPRGMGRAEQFLESQKRAERRERFGSEIESAVTAIPAALANISRDIPGMEAVQAGARAGARTLASRAGLPVKAQSYREALQDIRGATQALPAAVSIPTRLAGSTLAAMALPGGVATQSAIMGGLSGVTEANPDVGAEERIVRGIGQAAISGALGKSMDVGSTVARAFRTPTRAAQMIATRKARDEAANPLYASFREMGELPRTEALDKILSLPVVRRATRTVRSESPNLRELADTDARVLDAVYKRIGSKAFAAKHGFEAGEARATLLSAIDEASGGAYSPAVEAFREPSAIMSATQRGARALQRSMSPSGGATAKAALEEGPEALAEWSKTATPEQRRAALRGILGDLRQRGITDLLTPFGVRSGTISFVPGVRRAVAASEMVNALDRNQLRRVLQLATTTGLTPRESGIPMPRE